MTDKASIADALFCSKVEQRGEFMESRIDYIEWREERFA